MLQASSPGYGVERETFLLLRLLGCGALLLGSACSQGESAREEQAMKAAIPQRLQPDGTVKTASP